MIAIGLALFELTTVMIDVQSNNEVIEFEFKLTERRTTYVEKKSNHCKPYHKNGPSFSQCAKDFIAAYIEANLKCFLPGRAHIQFSLSRIRSNHKLYRNVVWSFEITNALPIVAFKRL